MLRNQNKKEIENNNIVGSPPRAVGARTLNRRRLLERPPAGEFPGSTEVVKVHKIGSSAGRPWAHLELLGIVFCFSEGHHRLGQVGHVEAVLEIKGQAQVSAGPEESNKGVWVSGGWGGLLAVVVLSNSERGARSSRNDVEACADGGVAVAPTGR